MQNVTNDYKNLINTKTSLTSKYKIVIDGIEYLSNVIKSRPKIKHSNSNFIGGFSSKTVSFEIYDFNDNIILEEKNVEIYKGLIVNGTIEYVKQGVFIPKADNITTNKSQKTILVSDAQDKTRFLDTKYSSNLNWNNGQKHTGLEIVQEICLRKNITLANENFNFSNYLFKRPNFSSNITDREVISRIAEIGGEIPFFNYDGNLIIKSQFITGDEITNKRYKKLTKEKKYEINTVVLGNEGYDNDILFPENILEVRSEYKILDNPFVDLYKQEMIEEVANHLIGLSYTPFELTEFVDGFIYELNDVITVIDKNNNAFNAVILNIADAGRLSSNFKADILDKKASDYKLAGSNKKTMTEIKMSVDHINNTLTSTITKIEEESEKIINLTENVDGINLSVEQNTTSINNLNQQTSKLSIDLDKIRSEIGDVTEMTVLKETTEAKLEFESINASEPLNIKIHPTIKDLSALYFKKNLLFNEGLYFKSKPILQFHNLSDNTIYNYKLPVDLLLMNSIYDELSLDYSSEEAKLIVTEIKRIAINSNGEKYILFEPQTINLSSINIDLTAGDYEVKILNYDSAYLSVRLMSQNMYTSQFATRTEMNSSITLAKQSINLEVNEKVELLNSEIENASAKIDIKSREILQSVSQTYATKDALSQAQSSIQISLNTINSNISNNYTTKSETTQLSNTINQKIDKNINSITLEVNKKVNNQDYTYAKIAALINNDTSNVLIQANKINLEGYLTISNANNTYASKSSLSSGTTTINGGCITTGTIDASRVTLKGNLFNYSSDGYLALAINNTNISFYNWKSSSHEYIGSMSSLANISTGAGKVGVYSVNPAEVVIGYKENSSTTSVESVITINPASIEAGHPPRIINTVGGTLFPNNPNGGIKVESGLIVDWNMYGLNTNIMFEDNNGATHRLTFKDGLLVDYSNWF